ncbi:MAG: hypothetical protein BA871_16165 [Desulfuromonadales bacterium C00003096]|nr:MAG: hypothetical protein BA871_16165 [Desulfuromonadales bacterium C00003096]
MSSNTLGYSALQLAMLFLLYEFCGVITNLLGGWVGSQFGLKITLFAGLALQVIALIALAGLQPDWPLALSVAYVMSAQALSGIAKDLTKMSSKSAIKVLLPKDEEGTLFKWVALLTGSKNALKGIGFFLGGMLLSWLGFRAALLAMAGALALVLFAAVLALPRGMGRASSKVKFPRILAKDRNINILSAARLFLFGSRDVWFVVGLPVFLAASLGWSHTQIGGFLALWVIGYGGVQALAPKLLRRGLAGGTPQGGTAAVGAFTLAGLDRPYRLGRTRIPLPLADSDSRPGPVRPGVRHQLVGPQLPDPGLHRKRSGRPQRQLLLHGQRRRTLARHPAFRPTLSTWGPARLPVGVYVPGFWRRTLVPGAASGDTSTARRLSKKLRSYLITQPFPSQKTQ